IPGPAVPGSLTNPVNQFSGHGQRLAAVAQGTAKPITYDDGGERSMLSAVFPIDVLNDFFASVVLKIDINIGWLVAFATDEAGKQKLAAFGVHLGNAQAIANGRIGCRTSALTKYAQPAGMTDNIVNRQEVGLILQFGNQGELLFQLLHHAVGYAVGIAAPGSFQGLLAQVICGCQGVGQVDTRILISKLTQVE